MSFFIILILNGLLAPFSAFQPVWILNNHEFHISNCEIELRPEQANITLVAHIFIDDLEVALKQQGFDSLYIMTEKEHLKADDIIGQYLSENLKLIADQKKLTFTFLGKEPSEDLIAVWCYMEVVDAPKIEHLEIKNTILLSTFEDQKNITSFQRSGEKKQHFLFEKGDEIQKVAL